MSLGQRLKDARVARGLTGTALADLTGINSSSISRWERGQRRPGADYVAKLADVLGVNERWLVTGEGPRERGRPLVSATPVGADALEAVLFAYEWPDVPVEIADEVASLARVEVDSPEGRSRPASVWRLRLSQLLRARSGGRARPRILRGG